MKLHIAKIVWVLTAMLISCSGEVQPVGSVKTPEKLSDYEKACRLKVTDFPISQSELKLLKLNQLIYYYQFSDHKISAIEYKQASEEVAKITEQEFSDFGDDLIEFTCEKGYIYILDFFLSKGYDPNKMLESEGISAIEIVLQNGFANYPLDRYTKLKYYKILQMLLSKNPNLNIINRQGRTPIFVAEAWQPELVPMLRKKGAKYSIWKNDYEHLGIGEKLLAGESRNLEFFITATDDVAVRDLTMPDSKFCTMYDKKNFLKLLRLQSRASLTNVLVISRPLKDSNLDMIKTIAKISVKNGQKLAVIRSFRFEHFRVFVEINAKNISQIDKLLAIDYEL